MKVKFVVSLPMIINKYLLQTKIELLKNLRRDVLLGKSLLEQKELFRPKEAFKFTEETVDDINWNPAIKGQIMHFFALASSPNIRQGTT